jgi:superfamily II DNA/RNA helicase
VSELLAREAVAHHVYHKAVPQEQRDAALAAVADAAESSGGGGGGGNVVVVSTDAAARGIDLPGVTHVVQADFATNAVDFLHRIGRTARADAGGRVTSLVAPDADVLAGALRACIEEGRPVEGCFSRNRSFARKVKRYGGFVPRGQAGGGGGGGEEDGGA